MFIGHFGLAFASQKAKPTLSLGTTIMAAQFLDLLWPFFSLAGWEYFSIDPGNTRLTPLKFEHYPYSHSLVGSALLALVFGAVYYVCCKNGRGAIICFLLVMSHWILDLITHRPDLPLLFDDKEKYGLGLWNHPALSIILESLIFILGIYWYRSATTALNKKGNILLWVLIGLLTLFFVLNLAGPPPPSEAAVTYSAMLMWLFVGLGYWIGANRKPAMH